MEVSRGVEQRRHRPGKVRRGFMVVIRDEGRMRKQQRT